MRYISPFTRLAIYDYAGRIRHQFEQNELVVGLPTDTSVGIDAATKLPYEDTLMRVYENGITTANELLEKVGLGYLDDPNRQYRLFYEAPWLTSAPTAKTRTSWWEVKDGTVTYNGRTYTVGQTIELASGDTLTLGTNAIIAELIPPYLTETCTYDPTPEFRRNVLLEGDETNDYFLWNGGFRPRNSTDPDSQDYVGWFRP